jgi:hypothetical protein
MHFPVPQFLKRRPARLPWTAWLAVVVAVPALFCLYAFMPLFAPAIPTSPDESANLFFSRWFAQTGELHYFDSWNLYADGAVHPRSVVVADNFLVPGGFVGLPVIFGGLAKLVGPGLIPFFSPSIALLGLLGFGLLSARLFGRRAGALAAALLALHPVWWYETARTMQSSALFFTLAIWGTWFLVVAPLARVRGKHGIVTRFADGAAAGVLFALALAVRMSEAYWLVIATVIVACTVRPLPWRRLVGAMVAGALALAPFLLQNYSLYGSVLATGYGAVGQGGVTGERLQGLGMRLLGPLQPYLFPLGFAPRTAIKHFWMYGLGFFPWWTVIVAAAVAFAVAAKRRARALFHPLVVAALAVAAWLIFFYGSWTIYDSPDPTAVTIGSSYLRYWLPLFIVSVWPVAWAAAKLWDKARWRPWLVALAVLLAGFSAATVFGAPGEGLLAMRAANQRYVDVKAGILKIVENKSIIVVDRADKFLFPDRSVIVPLRSDATFAILPKMVGKTDVYYFGVTFPAKDFNWLNEVRLKPLGLQITPVKAFGEETLYIFDKAPTAVQP